MGNQSRPAIFVDSNRKGSLIPPFKNYDALPTLPEKRQIDSGVVYPPDTTMSRPAVFADEKDDSPSPPWRGE